MNQVPDTVPVGFQAQSDTVLSDGMKTGPERILKGKFNTIENVYVDQKRHLP